MDNHILVNLIIAGKEIEVSIHKNQEEVCQKAVRQINDLYQKYHDYLNSQNTEDIDTLRMVALQLSVELVTIQEDTLPYLQNIEQGSLRIKEEECIKEPK